jgi:hypothetical protein
LGCHFGPRLYMTLLLSLLNRLSVFFEALEKLRRSGRRCAPSQLGLSEKPLDDIVRCRRLRERRGNGSPSSLGRASRSHFNRGVSCRRRPDHLLVAFSSELLVRPSWLERSMSLASVSLRPELRNMGNDHFRETAKCSGFPNL